MRIDVLGVGFDDLTMAEAVAAGARLLTEEGCHYVVTPNPEIVEACRENPAAMAAVKRELGGWRAAISLMAQQTGVAWVTAFVVYQVGRLFGLA